MSTNVLQLGGSDQPRQPGLMVKNVLRQGLPVIGRIKIGEKNPEKTSQSGNKFQSPKKLDYFKITTLQRDHDDNFLLDEHVHKILGPEPKDVPIRLLYNDVALSWQTQLAAYVGKTRWCWGDGEVSQRVNLKTGEVANRAVCLCPHFTDPNYKSPKGTQDGKCKLNGRLTCLVEGANRVGGVWVFHTTSKNSCQQITASLDWLNRATRGRLAFLPLILSLRPKTTTTPAGVVTKIQIVSLSFPGGFEDLLQQVEHNAERDLKFGARLREIEHDMLQLAAPAVLTEDGEEASDLVEEFYPETATSEVVLPASIVRTPPAPPVHEPLQDEADDGTDLIDDGAQDDGETTAAEPEDRRVEAWGSDLDGYKIEPERLEEWLIDEARQISDLEVLEEFAGANMEHCSLRVTNVVAVVRRNLQAKQTTANAAPGSSPAAEKPTNGGAAKAEEDNIIPPPPPTGEFPVMVMWPGRTAFEGYTLETFATAYKRRRDNGSADFEERFQAMNPKVFATQVPAELKRPANPF